MKLLYNESATLLPKRVEGVLYSFYQNVWRLSLFRMTVFRFSHVESFGYDNAPNEDTVTFLGNFPISSKIGGRADESNHGILNIYYTPDCS